MVIVKEREFQLSLRRVLIVVGRVLIVVDQTWRHQLLPATIVNPVIFSIYFINKDEGWLVCFENGSDSGMFTMHTLDGGNEWKQISTSTHGEIYHFIYFSDHSNGWALARNITVYSTTVYRTIDGGRTWQKSLSLD